MKFVNSSKQPRSFIVDSHKSPHARLHPVELNAVILEDDFWRIRRQVNNQVMLPAQYNLCEETGRIDNFRRASGRKEIDFQGMFFNDSDVYKWLEASAWSLSSNPDPELEGLIDNVIREIAAAQCSDGYINTYFTFDRADQRWTNYDLHELYCAGHLIQAAIAYYRVAGKTTLLEIAVRFADHICEWFNDDNHDKLFSTGGHPEIEMALVELFRVTGDKKYLLQAQYFIDSRGSRTMGAGISRYNAVYYQDDVPFRQLNRLEGHAVRAVYLNCGAADLVAETGEKSLLVSLNQMWQNMISRQMYINGGLGSRYESEGFGEDYELPNGRAHTETCASIANFMWNWRMLMLKPEGRYADVMELDLYNSILSGASLDGKEYFYQNPLMDDGHHRRKRWFTVSCCPSNISRLLATLPAYLYSVSTEGIWVHLFTTNQATISLVDGQNIRLAQRTNYPWDGDIELTVKDAGKFNLFLRLPGWCNSAWSVTLNGNPVPYTMTEGRYIQIERDWCENDTIKLHLPMDIQRITCHPNVVENQGRVALTRGPLLYCLESVDHPTTDVRHFVLADDTNLNAEFVPDLLGGVVILRGKVGISSDDSDWDDKLYRTNASSGHNQPIQNTNMMAIPYYAWANRTPGPMLVWLRRAGD